MAVGESKMENGSFEPVVLRAGGEAAVEVCPYGAQVTSWRTQDGQERLFLSRTAEFRAGAAIRGGVPIIFPQFAGLGALPKHGFARIASWQLIDTDNEAGNSVRFRLNDTAATQMQWQNRFVAEYLITLGPDALRLRLSVHNPGDVAFGFTAALHTYLYVSDISHVSVSGLQGLQYSDSAAGGVERVESNDLLRIAGEVDRIYFDSRRSISVMQPEQRTLLCSIEGFTDTVIWNPGPEKAATLGDLEPDGYRHMLCVEAAAIGRPIVLQPGSSWTGVQHLQVV